MRKDIDALIKKYCLTGNREAIYNLKQRFIQIYAYESWEKEEQVIDRLEAWLLDYVKLSKNSSNN